MYCRNCGYDIGDANYCPKCGTSQNDRSAAASVKPVFEPGYTKTVNKIAYGVIAILIGILGIHRFYAGKILSGILYLLFFWTGIPGILGLVEGIIALCAKSDENDQIPVYSDKYFVGMR